MKKHVTLKTCVAVCLLCCAPVLHTQATDNAREDVVVGLQAAVKPVLKPLAAVIQSRAVSKVDFESALNDVVAADGVQYKDAQGKIHGTMGMLNAILTTHAVGLVRIELAYKAAAKTFKELAAIDDNRAVVDQKMTYILAPVKEFFGEVHKYSNLLIPLVKLSIGTNHATGISEKDSLVLTYLTGTEQDAGNFFAKNVTTLPQLVQAAYEFIVFFKDMKASFSPEARAAGREYMRMVEQNKRAAAANRA